ncbi:MAG: hypothetical protein H6718_25650 [Polyangiaceae bacterium]|nr:hypothetical protein [Myxococcales bacterium]MCB9588822.1 hypothetical protein [Polyangiaceae bacterium]MCB9605381.1 hypothetical protein [Polyangiaceae bacterium]
MTEASNAGAEKPFQRDPSHWLFKLSPEEWIQAALVELRRAEAALAGAQLPAAYAGLKRAAGMALNGALILEPREWGRSYVDHLTALAQDADAPAAVREAASRVAGLKASPGEVVNLRTPKTEERWVEAAKTVMAHAYAVVHRQPHGAPKNPHGNDLESDTRGTAAKGDS